MARTAQDVTDAELGILQVLWDLGPAPIRRLTDELYPDGGVAQYATVQKLLERLETKGYVSRNRKASVHVFAAAVAKDELIGRRLQSLAEKDTRVACPAISQWPVTASSFPSPVAVAVPRSV